MKYEVKFPGLSLERKFEKNLVNISSLNIREEIMREIQKLEGDPRPFGQKLFKQLKPPISLSQYTAQYRIRIGDFRVLYDVDDARKVVWILALRRRSEKTYK